MSRTYVSDTEFVAATGIDASTDQLRRASVAVDAALIGAIYEVDADSLPTDAGVLEAMKDATTAQARALVAAEGDRVVKSATLGGASYTYADPIPGGLNLPGGGGLCPDAVNALRVAGLLPVGVITYG